MNRVILWALAGLALMASVSLVLRSDLPPPRLTAGLISPPGGAEAMPTAVPTTGSADLQYGEPATWQIPLTGVPAATLTVIPVHVRRSDMLDLQDVAQGISGLVPPVRHAVPAPVAGGAPGLLALGRLEEERTLQACIVPGHARAIAHIGHEPLEQAVTLAQPHVSWRRLRQLLGLAPARHWECLLVTLRMLATDTAPETLLGLWAQLKVATPPN